MRDLPDLHDGILQLLPLCLLGPLRRRRAADLVQCLGQLHTALAGYKRDSGRPAAHLRAGIAAVLWRFLKRHESCLAERIGAPEAFEIVTVVPSGDLGRDAVHPLRRIVGEVLDPTRGRYEHLLQRSEVDVPTRVVDPQKYIAVTPLHGEGVLLIDDTWTTGASAQSAAGALKAAGAGRVGVVVVGRHVHEEFEQNAARLAALPRSFDWERCALEGE